MYVNAAFEKAAKVLNAGRLPDAKDYAVMSEHIQGVFGQMVYVDAVLVNTDDDREGTFVLVEFTQLENAINLELRQDTSTVVHTVGWTEPVAKTTGPLLVSRATLTLALLELMGDHDI
jgi:hypothetical protein